MPSRCALQALLQEEPTDRLDTAVRQKAMLAIAAMRYLGQRGLGRHGGPGPGQGPRVGHRVPHRGRSTPLPSSPCSRAGLLPQDRTNGLLRACLCSVFHLPGHEDTRDTDTSLYFKVCTGWALGTPLLPVRVPQPLSSLQTMEALDSLLQVLVGSAGASGLLELQNILKVWLWQRLGFTHAVSSLPQRLVQAGVPKAGAGPQLALARLEGCLGSNGKGAGASAGQGHGHPPGHRSRGTAGRTSAPCCGHTSSFSLPSSCCPSPSGSQRPWRRGPWRGSPGWPPSSTPAPCPR